MIIYSFALIFFSHLDREISSVIESECDREHEKRIAQLSRDESVSGSAPAVAGLLRGSKHADTFRNQKKSMGKAALKKVQITV